MEAKAQSKIDSLLPLFIQTGIGILVLLFSWLVTLLLPMFNEIKLPLQFSLAELFAALILTGIIVILVMFGLRVQERLEIIMTMFPHSGRMAKLTVYLLVTVIGYYAYSPLLTPYLGTHAWIYPLVFLILFLSILASIGLSIYSYADLISKLITKKTKPPSGPTCTTCGAPIRSGASFCAQCGAQVATEQPIMCSSCSTVLKPGSESCPACGSDHSQTPSSTTNRCVSCGTTMKDGARFCPACGTESA